VVAFQFTGVSAPQPSVHLFVEETIRVPHFDIFNFQINKYTIKKKQHITHCRTVQQSNRTILEIGANSILLTHIYMTAHFRGFWHFNKNVAGLN